ncbi:hypothetical protein [Roseivivax marinus]|uniref:hypothetical protein n=1 Tax=Roseivivax marinus TaxID=1379903 RepID=UPI0027401A4D|nr:hypothetical protein [Roseivivax marinus]
MNFRIITYGLLAWCSASLAVAQDHNIPTIAPVRGAFKEFVREGALISGSVVVGMQVRSTETKDVRLTGFIPEAWKGEDVCAQALSIDGLYEGLGSYSLPDDWGG